MSETEEDRRVAHHSALDAAGLARLTGPLDVNQRRLAESFSVRVTRRGPDFVIEGERAAAAASALRQAEALAAEGAEVSAGELQLIITAVRDGLGKADDSEPLLRVRRRGLRPRTANQRAYLEALREHDVVFAIGPAGTGKTYLAVAAAIDAFERGQVERLVLTRPAIEAGERLGFLPGDLSQKVDPYLRPLYDALFDLFGFDRTRRLIERQTIEIAPLAYMRGRTINNAVIILDEAQNTTVEQMKMFLTRIGFGARAVITGDVTQVDLPRGARSGLAHAAETLAAVPGIAVVNLTVRDVVRHPLVGAIVEAYAAREARERGVS